MKFFRYLCVLLPVVLVGCAAGPHGGPVFIPWELAKAGVDRVRYPNLYKSDKSSSEPAWGCSYKTAVLVGVTASRKATIAFEDDWTYRNMETFHRQLPPLVDFSQKIQRATERQEKKVFDVVTTPCPNGNVHIYYFDVTGTPLD